MSTLPRVALGRTGFTPGAGRPRVRGTGAAWPLVLALSACGPNYAPDTYSRQAVQQANKVDQGEVVGWREVTISADGTVGFVTGSAAGGIAGSQAAGGIGSAFGALGGTLVGGLVGGAVEQGTGDLKGFEYVVRKPNGELLSVVQRDKRALGIGQRVLLISGSQARVVPDYTVTPVAAVPPPAALAPTPGDVAFTAPVPPPVASAPLAPLP